MAFIANLSQEKPPSAFVYTIPELAPRAERERANVIRYSKQEHTGAFSNEQARNNAAHVLTNYSKSDLLASLKHFSKKSLRLNSDEFEIKPAEEIGYSGDKVYIIWNKQKKSLGALKVFKEDSKNFFPEIFSLAYLKDAQIPAFASPRIEALGKCEVNDNRYFLLCETAAPGCSLLGHYKNALPIEKLEKGMYKCGFSLAKLHQHLPGTITKIPADFEKRTREYLEKAAQNLTTFPQPGIDVKKLRELFERSLKEMGSEEIPAAVIHGDTKLVNVFYDPVTDEITWIDPPKLSESVHPSGSSIGIPIKDFYSFIADIPFNQMGFFLDAQHNVCSKKLISDENIPLLVNAFCEGYQAGGGKLPTKKQLNFFSLASHLYFAADPRPLDPECSIPEPSKTSRKYRMAKILQDLEMRLNLP